MRLAFGMGRTVAELRETMDAHEWARWLLYHELFDLPDGFMVSAVLGTLVNHAVGGKGIPENYAPYYKAESKSLPVLGTNNLRPFYGFLSAYAKERSDGGSPIPRSTRKDRL